MHRNDRGHDAKDDEDPKGPHVREIPSESFENKLYARIRSREITGAAISYTLLRSPLAFAVDPGTLAASGETVAIR